MPGPAPEPPGRVNSMRAWSIILGSAACLAAMGCASFGFMAQRPDALCRLSPVGAGGAAGRVTFTQKDGYVLVEAVLDGLKPGLHGFHAHEKGDCAGVGALAAGGHFDPTLQPHGPGAEEGSHLGDLGNLLADAQGHAKLSLRDRWIRLSGPNSILGRALIVQAEPDDLHSQPSGGGGERIACGIILAPR